MQTGQALAPELSPVDEIFRVFEQRGSSQYFGENVTQLEHALQAAFFARQTLASQSLVAAALLHDFGHLLHDLGVTASQRGIDARHEDLGEVWLSRYFPAAITEPIRLHVAAKRYLCAVQSEYHAQLSPASVESLALQGGLMSPGEVNAFERNPFYREAVALRRFDDKAKLVGLSTPGLGTYRDLLLDSLVRKYVGK